MFISGEVATARAAAACNTIMVTAEFVFGGHLVMYSSLDPM